LRESIVEWLLQGDISIQFQTYRDLLGEVRYELQERIVTEGWGARFLSHRNADGSWGRGFYQPKWTCTHYTLLDLKTLQVLPSYTPIRESIHAIACTEKGADGGINPATTVKDSDVCINGMFLNYACYFGEDQGSLESVVDFILDQRMNDGGFNCERDRSGARHSSLHSTLSVAEGISEYVRAEYQYRLQELKDAAASSQEFILQHRLFKSDHTGEIIHKDLLRLAFPPRWKYNILRALDYFRGIDLRSEPRINDAIHVLKKKQLGDGRWPLQSAHRGRVHFTMENVGTPSRWNTLLGLRVIDHFESQGQQA